jgi:hypothetical protein|nr:MAG TPA: Head Tail Connector Protein [Caudoviricetes sp.]
MTVTAEYYSENWGDWADTGELTAALRRAEIIVDREIFPSGYTVSTVPGTWRTAAQNAVCAQAEFILENGGVPALSETTDGGSVSLGKFSYSGGSSGSSGGSAVNSLCAQALALLEPTGLLYRGVSL